MNFFGRSKTRSPAENVKLLRDLITKLDQSNSTDTRRRVSYFRLGEVIAYVQINDDISKSVTSLKIALVGDAEHDPSSDVVAQVANEVYGQDLLSLLVTHLGQFDFEVSQLSGFPSMKLIERHAKIPLQFTVRYCVEQSDLDHLLLNLSLDVRILSLILSRGKLHAASRVHESS